MGMGKHRGLCRFSTCDLKCCLSVFSSKTHPAGVVQSDLFSILRLQLEQNQWLMGGRMELKSFTGGSGDPRGESVVTEDPSVFEIWFTGASTSAPSHKDRPDDWILSSCTHALFLVPFSPLHPNPRARISQQTHKKWCYHEPHSFF